MGRSSHYHIYLVHLAVADLISSIIIPFRFIYGATMDFQWYLTKVGCTIIGNMALVSVTVSCWVLVW